MIKLEPGYRKGSMNNIPIISNDMMCEFIRTATTDYDNAVKVLEAEDEEKSVDFVQVRTTGEIIDVKGIVFTKDIDAAHIFIQVDKKKAKILRTSCHKCPKLLVCSHLRVFVFWLHRKSTDTFSPAIQDFWGSEILVPTTDSIDACRIRDIFGSDERRLEMDVDATNMQEIDGENFAEAVLNEFEALDIREAAFYKHRRPVFEEFEPLFVHHALLDAPNNGIRNIESFLQHMEDQAKQGLFERLSDVTKNTYKTPLWIEAQYMRIRCSLIHQIATRKDTSLDEQIFEMMFCKDRSMDHDQRQYAKEQKRFILKQTEKLESKFYNECGVLLNENYPYLCATPDGIADDHIVEIKAPKTEADFERYLEGRESIAPKYMAQIQVQMYMANVTKGLYCVLSPGFDKNGALHYVWVQADIEFVANLLGAAEDFWKEVVFPRLVRIYKK